MSAQGVSIKIFLVDGVPDGLRIVERSNWTGLGIVCARSQYAGVRNRPEFSRPGLYVLVGPGEGILPRIYMLDLRDELIATGILADDGSSLRVTQDYVFNSPSTAAGVLLGRTANGRIEWRNEKGVTLKMLQAQSVES